MDGIRGEAIVLYYTFDTIVTPDSALYHYLCGRLSKRERSCMGVDVSMYGVHQEIKRDLWVNKLPKYLEGNRLSSWGIVETQRMIAVLVVRAQR